MSATQFLERFLGLPRETQHHIMSFIDIPVELWGMSNPHRKRQIAIKRSVLGAYGYGRQATVVLDMAHSRTIPQLKKDLDDFAALLEASIAFQHIGMAYQLKSFTFHVSTPAAGEFFLKKNKRIRRILRLLNNNVVGLEFFGIFARSPISYQKFSSTTVNLLHEILDSKRIAHVLLRGLEDLPDQLIEGLKSREKMNLEIYECSTISQGNLKSMGWEWGKEYKHCYFEADSQDFVLPSSMDAVQGSTAPLRKVRIHLPAVPREEISSSNNRPELPRITLQLFTGLTSLHLTQASATLLHRKQLFSQFNSCLLRSTFPPSLTKLKIETVAIIVLGHDEHLNQHLSNETLNELDERLADPSFHAVVDVTIGITCYLFHMSDNPPPISQAERRQIQLRIEDDMEAGFPHLSRAHQLNVRRHRFDITVEDETTYEFDRGLEYAPVRAGSKKQLVVPFFEPDPGFWRHA